MEVSKESLIDRVYGGKDKKPPVFGGGFEDFNFDLLNVYPSY
jgi:hypothetical protein